MIWQTQAGPSIHMPFSKNSLINQPFWLDSKERTKAGYGGMCLVYSYLEHGDRGSQVQGCLWLRLQFDTSLGDVRHLRRKERCEKESTEPTISNISILVLADGQGSGSSRSSFSFFVGWDHIDTRALLTLKCRFLLVSTCSLQNSCCQLGSDYHNIVFK